MTYWDHVYDLRKKIFIILISIVIFSFAGYYLFPYLIDIIIDVIGEDLYVSVITEGFITRIKIAVIIGLTLSIPMLLFQLVLFVFPALKRSEKIFILIGVISCSILFILGVFFSYKVVLPISIRFLKSEFFYPQNVNRIIFYNKFITFFFQFLLGFGVCFQFPILIIILLKLNIIQMNFLIKNFKYFIIICFIISAVLTPPDILSQLLLGLPMILLYLLCIVIGKIIRLGD